MTSGADKLQQDELIIPKKALKLNIYLKQSFFRKNMNYIDIATIIKIKIAFALAYFPVVTLAGFLQSWIMNLAGDSSAKDEGFATLNPAVHFDSYGYFILIFPWQLFGIDINIGFGKMIPNDLDGAVVSRYNFLKKFIIAFSAAISYFISTFAFGIILQLYYIFLFNSHYAICGSLFQISAATVSLSRELTFVFTILNLVDLILYKFDKDGAIKYNPFVKLLIVLAIASILSPLLSLIFS